MEDAAAIIALTHCLARDAAEHPVTAGTPPELIAEGMFRAARFGVHASLPGPDGQLRPVAELLADAIRVATRHAAELGCEAELKTLPGLLRREGGAGRQRRMHELAGMDALLRDLTALTLDGA